MLLLSKKNEHIFFLGGPDTKLPKHNLDVIWQLNYIVI